MLNTHSKWKIQSRFKSKFAPKKWNKSDAIDMVAIYEKKVGKPTKRTPGGYIACCPFPDHEDRTPSFVMYQDDQSYYCFGCNKSGTASWFKREMEKIYGV